MVEKFEAFLKKLFKCTRAQKTKSDLKQLLCTELEDVVNILLAERSVLAAHAGLDNQMGQHHLFLGHLRNSLLYCVPK